MEIAVINDTIKINKEKTVYTIEFGYTSYQLINSLIKTRIISGASTDEFYKTIRFKAETVKTLNEFLHYRMIKTGKKKILISDAAKMIRNLSRQLKYLIEVENHTILGYNPSEIIVINDDQFVYLGDESVVSIESDDMAMISYPFSLKNMFAPPELFKVTEIPFFTNYKTAYFSLGLLVIYVLLGDDEFYHDFLKHSNSSAILNILDDHPIKNTRIYWLLSRCLVEEPKNRSIILI
jgi:hypothetical protein